MSYDGCVMLQEASQGRRPLPCWGWWTCRSIQVDKGCREQWGGCVLPVMTIRLCSCCGKAWLNYGADGASAVLCSVVQINEAFE